MMRTNKRNSTIVDGYVVLLNHLDANNKLELIAKLSASIKEDINIKKSAFKKSFGAFESSNTAEEIIEDIRKSRVSNRQTQSF